MFTFLIEDCAERPTDICLWVGRAEDLDLKAGLASYLLCTFG